MRHKIYLAVVALGLLPLASCGGSTTVRAQTGFSNSTLSGPYAFSFRGVENHGIRVAAVGSLMLDGSGGITSGSERRTEEDGAEFALSITGRYTVGNDGTGTLTMNLNGAAVDTWATVISAGGQRVKLVSIQPNTFFFGVVEGEMERQ